MLGQKSSLMPELPSIPPSPTLAQLQQYQQEICAARGWDKSSVYELWLFFTEEIGELAKAIRNHEKLYQETGAKAQPQLEEEFADVLSYLLDLATRMGVDLETVYRAKEAKNAGRTWS